MWGSQWNLSRNILLSFFFKKLAWRFWLFEPYNRKGSTHRVASKFILLLMILIDLNLWWFPPFLSSLNNTSYNSSLSPNIISLFLQHFSLRCPRIIIFDKYPRKTLDFIFVSSKNEWDEKLNNSLLISALYCCWFQIIHELSQSLSFYRYNFLICHNMSWLCCENRCHS